MADTLVAPTVDTTAANEPVFVKDGTTEVKYMKDGVEVKEDVPYQAKQARDLEGAMQLADQTIPEIGAEVKDGDTVTKVTAENRQDLMVEWILAKFNAVMEANARQNARNAFLTNIAGPDKAIQAMAKKLAAIKKITEAEAEAQIRKSFGL
jgi:hypothetical protein